MTSIGIYGDFFYGGDEYAIRHFSESDYCDKEVLYFQNKKELRALLSMMMKNSGGSVWVAFNTVIQEISPGMCETMGDECDGQTLDFLCEKIYNQEWVLVKRRYADNCESLRFEKCCVDSMKQIESIVENIKLLGPILCIAQVTTIFASHTRTPDLISALSAAYFVKDTDWKIFAKAMASLPEIKRESIHNVTMNEVIKHDKDNKQELKKYWEKIYDASA